MTRDPYIERIEIFPVAYPTQGSFRYLVTPAGLPPGRRTVVVKLTDSEGAVGWGQSVPSFRWSYETPETVRSTIEHYFASALIGRAIDDHAGIEQALASAVGPGFSTGHPVARAGLDLALWDLCGRRAGRTAVSLLADLYPPSITPTTAITGITLSWTLNPVDLADAESTIAEAHSRGYHHFNIKVAPDPKFDLELCRLVRRLAPSAFVWVDANGGYDVATALEVAPRLAELGIAALEQPLPTNRLTGYRELKTQGALPILMDESIVSTADFDEFRKLGLLDGVALKLARMGGLTETWRLIRRLHETNSRIYASGLTDPDLSLAASLQLYAAAGLMLPAALNAPQFLTGSILREPLVPQGDQLTVPVGPGLGVEVDEEKLKELSEVAK